MFCFQNDFQKKRVPIKKSWICPYHPLEYYLSFLKNIEQTRNAIVGLDDLKSTAEKLESKQRELTYDVSSQFLKFDTSLKDMSDKHSNGNQILAQINKVWFFRYLTFHGEILQNWCIRFFEILGRVGFLISSLLLDIYQK